MLCVKNYPCQEFQLDEIITRKSITLSLFLYRQPSGPQELETRETVKRIVNFYSRLEGSAGDSVTKVVTVVGRG